MSYGRKRLHRFSVRLGREARLFRANLLLDTDLIMVMVAYLCREQRFGYRSGNLVTDR
jgi:hypothetical protein